MGHLSRRRPLRLPRPNATRGRATPHRRVVPVQVLKYPDPGSSGEDLYDIAYRWGWETPELRELVYLCYKTPDLPDNARRYFASEELREAVRILSELSHPPSKDCRVLDFGCGNGVGCYALSRSGYWVLGIDASEGELAGLGAARKIRGLDGADFAVGPSRGTKLDLEDATFGVVWLREALHHIEDLPGFLAEAARILEPGGVICCCGCSSLTARRSTPTRTPSGPEWCSTPKRPGSGSPDMISTHSSPGSARSCPPGRELIPQ